jgi:hypothetical protein
VEQVIEVEGKFRALRPDIDRWEFTELEQLLLDHREEYPNWQVADECRRLLADSAAFLMRQLPNPVDYSKLNRPLVRPYAIASATTIALRAAGSTMVLVGGGYVAEGGGSLRRLVEAGLHCDSVLKDDSGDYAMRFLEGKGSKLATLVKKHGGAQRMATLSMLSHADPSIFGMLPKLSPTFQVGDGQTAGRVRILPAFDPDMGGKILQGLAHEAVHAAAAASSIIDLHLEVPDAIAQELDRLGALPPEPTGSKSEFPPSGPTDRR